MKCKNCNLEWSVEKFDDANCCTKQRVARLVEATSFILYAAKKIEWDYNNGWGDSGSWRDLRVAIEAAAEELGVSDEHGK